MVDWNYSFKQVKITLLFIYYLLCIIIYYAKHYQTFSRPQIILNRTETLK